MKTLLLGANGRTGREFLETALAANDEVTALVRGPDRMAGVQHPRLKVCVGSPCDAALLASLMPGHDVVVSALGPRRPTKSASAIYPDSATAIIEAMRQSAVRRLLVTSSALLFSRQDLFGRVLQRLVPRIVAAAREMEDMIRATELDWTIARTGFLTSEDSDDFETSDREGGTVSRAGVAKFLRGEAMRGRHVREVVGLTA